MKCSRSLYLKEANKSCYQSTPLLQSLIHDNTFVKVFRTKNIYDIHRKPNPTVCIHHILCTRNCKHEDCTTVYMINITFSVLNQHKLAAEIFHDQFIILGKLILQTDNLKGRIPLQFLHQFHISQWNAFNKKYEFLCNV